MRPIKGSRTIALNHKRFDNVMSNHLEVWVPNPVTDGSFGPREEVVENSYFMAEKHETVY